MIKISASHLQIEPTTVCNYTCGFCVGRHMPQKNMDLATFRTALSSIEDLKYISIQGEGEPLLNHSFFDMVAIAKELHPAASISFITNGSLFTRDNVARILELGIDRIMISIESADAKLFKEIRGGELKKVINGIGSLIQQRNTRGLTYPLVGFASTVLRKTLTETDKIVKLYEDLEMDGGIAWQYLQTMDSYYKIYSDGMKHEVLEADEIKLFHANTDAINKALAESHSKVNYYYSLFSSETAGCPWLDKGLYVDLNGLTTACCMIKDVSNHGFGHLEENNVAIIQRKRSEMQTQLLNGVIPQPCKNCSIAESVINRAQVL